MKNTRKQLLTDALAYTHLQKELCISFNRTVNSHSVAHLSNSAEQCKGYWINLRSFDITIWILISNKHWFKRTILCLHTIKRCRANYLFKNWWATIFEAKFFYQNIHMIRIIYSMPIELLHLNLIMGADLLGTGKRSNWGFSLQLCWLKNIS